MALFIKNKKNSNQCFILKSGNQVPKKNTIKYIQTQKTYNLGNT